MLNHAVDLTTDIIHSLAGEPAHGESKRWEQSATEDKHSMEEQLVFHSSVQIRLQSTKRKMCQKLYIDESEKNPLCTNVYVEIEGSLESWPVRWHMSVEHININMNVLTQNSSQV